MITKKSQDILAYYANLQHQTAQNKKLYNYIEKAKADIMILKNNDFISSLLSYRHYNNSVKDKIPNEAYSRVIYHEVIFSITDFFYNIAQQEFNSAFEHSLITSYARMTAHFINNEDSDYNNKCARETDMRKIYKVEMSLRQEMGTVNFYHWRQTWFENYNDLKYSAQEFFNHIIDAHPYNDQALTCFTDAAYEHKNNSPAVCFLVTELIFNIIASPFYLIGAVLSLSLGSWHSASTTNTEAFLEQASLCLNLIEPSNNEVKEMSLNSNIDSCE